MTEESNKEVNRSVNKIYHKEVRVKEYLDQYYKVFSHIALYKLYFVLLLDLAGTSRFVVPGFDFTSEEELSFLNQELKEAFERHIQEETDKPLPTLLRETRSKVLQGYCAFKKDCSCGEYFGFEDFLRQLSQGNMQIYLEASDLILMKAGDEALAEAKKEMVNEVQEPVEDTRSRIIKEAETIVNGADRKSTRLNSSH